MSRSRGPLAEEDRRRAAEIGIASLEAFYGSRSADLDGDSEFLQGYFERLLRRAGYLSLTIETRAKSLESAINKIKRKCVDIKSDYAKRILNGISAKEKVLSDLIGVRITCQFSDQIDHIAELIQLHCTLCPRERADHRHPKDYGNFGYAALHLVAEPFKASGAQIYFSGCAFEVQIRSALMDFWSVVNWDIAYTGEREIPYEIVRRMSTLSALFYLVDQEFIRIRDEMYLDLSHSQAVTTFPANAVQFCPEVSVALAKRGITFNDNERKAIAEQAKSAEKYIAGGTVLATGDTSDALILYLFDRERFAWILNERSIAALEGIERSEKGRKA